MSEWSHLPNAHHIDRVIESLKSHSELWAEARNVVWSESRNAGWNEAKNVTMMAAGDAVWSAAKNAAWYAVKNVTMIAAGDAAWYAARNAAWYAVKTADRNADRENAAWYAARNATLALISYDDSAKYLDMPSEKLRMWYILSEDPAAILLLPAVIAFEKINELECV